MQVWQSYDLHIRSSHFSSRNAEFSEPWAESGTHCVRNMCAPVFEIITSFCSFPERQGGQQRADKSDMEQEPRARAQGRVCCVSAAALAGWRGVIQ